MTVPATADSGQVLLGPGLLYVAAIGSTEPTAASAVSGTSGWTEVGYTEDGNSFDYTLTTADIFVEEEFDPVKVVTTARSASITVALAQITRRNLALVLNQGAAAANDGTAIAPPAPNAETRIMMALVTEEGAMWLIYRAVATGSVKVDRKKAPNKATFPVTFKAEKVAGKALFNVVPTTNGLV